MSGTCRAPRRGDALDVGGASTPTRRGTVTARLEHGIDEDRPQSLLSGAPSLVEVIALRAAAGGGLLGHMTSEL